MRLIPSLIFAFVLGLLGRKLWPDVCVWPLMYFTLVGSFCGGMFGSAMRNEAANWEGRK